MHVQISISPPLSRICMPGTYAHVLCSSCYIIMFKLLYIPLETVFFRRCTPTYLRHKLRDSSLLSKLLVPNQPTASLSSLSLIHSVATNYTSDRPITLLCVAFGHWWRTFLSTFLCVYILRPTDYIIVYFLYSSVAVTLRMFPLSITLVLSNISSRSHMRMLPSYPTLFSGWSKAEAAIHFLIPN